ncbi:hypothetical protein L596_022724 [Steinernema carpocapsae]|uniref:C-type lectin domain-containing protein n=1 Tax=Steinernema carpocapsae TaxID=34508 RepID=A0A4U5MMM0_STECR|nr:hypothetical protein L596_022724 [Steinernema carpocapsae]
MLHLRFQVCTVYEDKVTGHRYRWYNVHNEYEIAFVCKKSGEKPKTEWWYKLMGQFLKMPWLRQACGLFAFSMVSVFASQIPQNQQISFLTWKRYGNFLYHFSKIWSNWHAAEEYCVARGAHLVSIQSSKEQHFVADNCSITCWIGGKSQKKNKVFNWVDSTKMAYTAWTDGHPWNEKPISTCIQTVKSEGGKWIETKCHRFSQFVCKKAV